MAVSPAFPSTLGLEQEERQRLLSEQDAVELQQIAPFGDQRVISGSGNPPKLWLDWLDWLDGYVSVMTIGTKSSLNGRSIISVNEIFWMHIYELLFKWV